MKKYCVSLLEKFGSFDYTRKKMDKLNIEAVEEVKKLGGNPLMDEVLKSVFKFE